MSQPRPDEKQLRELMCEVGAMMWARGLVGATEGNISCRLNDEQLLCTPSGISKGHMRPYMILVVDHEGNPTVTKSGGPMGFRASERTADIPLAKPSSELKMHLGLYRFRPDAEAVVHAHPIHATAMGLVGLGFPADIMPEAAEVLGPVAIAPYATPGTEEVPDSLKAAATDHKTFILAHHGAVVIGKDLLDAYYRMETLERMAQIFSAAKNFGEPNRLPKAQFDLIAEKCLHGRL